MKDSLRIIDRWLNFQVFINELPGLSIGIIKDDKLIFHQTYGYSNIKRKKRTDKNTSYRIASISKLFTAIAIMQLVEKKKIFLNDEASKYLPWLNSDKGFKKITIKDLLTHTAKVKRDGIFPYWINDKFPNIEEIESSIKDNFAQKIPNKWKYSNLGFALLGEVISQVSGEDYNKYVLQNIIEKLGMKNTHPDLNELALKDLAEGYSIKLPYSKRKTFINPKTNALSSATGFVSNIEDLSKLAISLMKDSKLLSNNSKKHILSKQIKINDSFSYGLGCEIWSEKDYDIFGHDGGFAGFKTVLGISKKHNTSVILMANSIDFSPVQFLRGLFDILTLNKKPKYKVSEHQEGIYHCKWGFLQIANISSGLIGFYPQQFRPMSEIFRLKHKKGPVYEIVDTKDEYVGEEVEFISDDLIKVGPNIWKRFKIKKQ